MTDLPQSSYLSLSIKRAISAAQQRSHSYVTLEHLLLALLDDPAATAILEGVRADIPTIRRSISETVNHNLATIYTPGEFDLHASYKVERVLQTASDDADRLNCEELDAAFVLAALSRETENPAGTILKENGFAYTSAVTWLYANRGAAPSARRSRQPLTPAPEAAEVPAEEPAPRSTPAPSYSGGGPAAATARVEPEPMLEDEEAEAPAADPAEKAAPVPLDLDLDDEVPLNPPPSWLRRKPADSAFGTDAPPPGQGAQVQPMRRRQEGGLEDWRQPGERRESRPGQAPPPERVQGRSRDQEFRDREMEGAGATPHRRADPQVPPSSRLDEMRVRAGGAAAKKTRAPLPAPVPAPAPPAPAPRRGRARPAAAPAPEAMQRGAASADRPRARQRRKPGPKETLIGRLIENIPRRMRASVAERIEVRISREDTRTLTEGMEGRAEPVRHDLMITQTMSVALRAPDGGFTIEPLSPETQWIFDRPDNAEVYGRWRWVVTPQHRGERRLQLIIAGRSVGQNGLVGDSALPDQIITVRVRTNYWRVLGRSIQWLAVLIIGGILTELALVGLLGK
jgi:hypothetical protein